MEKIRERKEQEPAAGLRKIPMKVKDRSMAFKKRVRKMLDAKQALYVESSAKGRNSGHSRVAKGSIEQCGPVLATVSESMKAKVQHPVKKMLDPQLVNVVDANNVKNKKSNVAKVKFCNKKDGLDYGRRKDSLDTGTGDKKLKSPPLRASNLRIKKPKKRVHDIEDRHEIKENYVVEAKADLPPKPTVELTSITKQKKKSSFLEGFNKIVGSNLQPLRGQEDPIENKRSENVPSIHSSINMGMVQKIKKHKQKKLLESSTGNVTLPEAGQLEGCELPKMSKKADKFKNLCHIVDSPEFASIPKGERNLGTPIIFKRTPKKSSPLPTTSTPVRRHNKDKAKLTREEDILHDFVTVDVSNSKVVEIHHASSIGANVSSLDTSDPEDNDDTDNGTNDSIDSNAFNVHARLKRSLITGDDEHHQDSVEISSNEPMSSNNEFDSQATISPMENLDALKNVDLKNRPKFYSFQRKVVVIMRPKCKFYFNGKLRVKVLYGNVEIYGSVLNSSDTLFPAEVYSPRGSSLVRIETVDETDKGSRLEDIGRSLITEGIDCTLADDLQADIDMCATGQAVIVLENLENKLTKCLDTYCPVKLFPKLEDLTNYPRNHPRKAEIVLQSILQFGEEGKHLKTDPYWKEEIVGKLLERWTSEKPSCAVIAGGKGVGKSTMLRYLVNALLPKTKAVVVVDLDPGQAEFSPPGCISVNLVERPIMGPNFTHLKTPFHQLYIGDVNVIHCLPRYIKGVKKLIDYLVNCRRLTGLPVIVNTMGFCKGIGLDIMVYIIKLILPTNVIQIISERVKNNYNVLLTSEILNRQDQIQFSWDKDSPIWNELSFHTLHTVPSQAEVKCQFGDSWELEPRQNRDLVMLAYLSQIIIQDDEHTNRSMLYNYRSLPSINDTVPYMVPFSAISVSLTRTSVPPSHILATINGNIVALCAIEVKKDFSQNDDDDTDSSYPRTLIRTPLSTCYGFGIVRGIDVEKGYVFVNTPLSIHEMQFVNCFVGCIPMPTGMLQFDRHGLPYVGGQDDLPTSREPRRGYFRMRQQNTPQKAKPI